MPLSPHLILSTLLPLESRGDWYPGCILEGKGVDSSCGCGALT